MLAAVVDWVICFYCSFFFVFTFYASFAIYAYVICISWKSMASGQERGVCMLTHQWPIRENQPLLVVKYIMEKKKKQTSVCVYL